MTIIANVVLADGTTPTPVNLTFVPATRQSNDGAPATWFEKTTGNPLTYRRLSLSVKASATGASKVRSVIAYPIPAVIGAGCCVDSSTPQVAYTLFSNTEYTLPALSSRQNRVDILALNRSLQGHAIMTAAVADIEAVI